MNIRILSNGDIFTKRPEWREPGRSDYLAMYSSVFDGVVIDPALMVIPIDDHIINRGDGIFEYIPVHNGYAYCFEAHLTRLQKSAEVISLDLPFNIDIIRQITLGTVAISSAKCCGVRLFISRGLGDFSCDPTTPGKSILYIIVLKEPALPNRPPEGVTAMTTHVPVKPSIYAQVKTTCYLLNALVQLEAHRNYVQYGFWYDQEGHLTESSIDNVAIVTQDKILKYPNYDCMLKGTGLIRAVELAKELVKSGELNGICQADISQHEVYESSEILVLGSGDAFPVINYDGRVIGNGKPGQIFYRIWELLTKDRLEGPNEVRTPIPYSL
ncbi:aminotransferase class IV [Chloroflexota bacterium]